MDRVKLVVSERQESGSRAVNRLRKTGVIPGVLYSAGKHPLAISIPAHALREAMTTGAGRNAVLDVVLEGHKRGHAAVIKEVQLDPVRQYITHIDLHEIQLNEPIEAKVALQLEGTPAGVKAGGVFEMVVHEVTVRALPSDIPEHLDMNIDEIVLGQVVRVRELVLPDGVTVVDDPDEALFHVVPPRVLEEEVAPEAVAEPEVVGKEGEEPGAEE